MVWALKGQQLGPRATAEHLNHMTSSQGHGVQTQRGKVLDPAHRFSASGNFLGPLNARFVCQTGQELVLDRDTCGGVVLPFECLYCFIDPALTD
jgi:hypothetical protein